MVDNVFSDFIEEVKEKNNIVDVARRYVTLEQKGSNYWACCPFHGEKTASFAVNEEKGYYHCFGCGKHGDVFTFIQEIEHCSFFDAVKLLAERVGLEVPKSNSDAKFEARKKKMDRLYNLMRDCAIFYHNNLNSDNNITAMEYLNKRGIGKVTIKNFGLGYSPGFNQLVDYLVSQGYTKEEMLEAGVIEEKKGNIFDAEHGRLIIPIMNNTNKVIAFGGRALENVDFAKYKNTKETILFEKRKELFGVHTLKKAKLEQGFNNVIIVEGYMDVISLYQAGIKNVCASMGTSLTAEQAKLLKYYSNNIYLCYDGDDAGQNAIYRGIDILRDAGLNVKVITLPNNMDPDDIIKKFGVNKFRELISEAVPPTEYKLKAISKKFDLNNPHDQGKFAVESLKILSELSTMAEREAYLPLIRKMCGVSVESLRQDLMEQSKGLDFIEKTNKNDVIVRNKKNANVAKYYEAARFILLSIYQNLTPDDNVEDITPYLEDKEHIAIFDYARLLKENNKILSIDMLEGMENNSEADKILKSGYMKMTKDDRDKMYKDCMNSLKISSLKIHLEDLTKLYAQERNEKEKKQISINILDINTKINELKNI